MRTPLDFRLLVHQVHVGDERIGLGLLGMRVGFGPERSRVGADLGQEGIFLHRLGAERAVEIVDQRDGLLVELRHCRAPAGSAGFCGWLVLVRRFAPTVHTLDHDSSARLPLHQQNLQPIRVARPRLSFAPRNVLPQRKEIRGSVPVRTRQAPGTHINLAPWSEGSDGAEGEVSLCTWEEILGV